VIDAEVHLTLLSIHGYRTVRSSVVPPADRWQTQSGLGERQSAIQFVDKSKRMYTFLRRD
jgi:ATP phosphoribosyltransferase regulatory subunit HisZ